MKSVERKERLRRLSEMKRRALGVSSFEAPDSGLVVGCGSSAARELLMPFVKGRGISAGRWPGVIVTINL